jgi:diguanylate cyclase (GGDEF)-like protein
MARERDEESALRDHAADSRDRESAILDASDDLADRHTLRVEELRGRNRVSRRRAANDRELARRDRHEATDDREDATADRERAEGDRDEAALDRRQADGDRQLAGTDDLTGVRRRGVGLEELEREMQRAQRDRQNLVAAFVDVNGLKAVNDEHGHDAGDALLRRTAHGLSRHMRPYDLIIRLGGDEFLCVLPGMTLETAKERLGSLSGELAEPGAGEGAISIGYSEFRGGDSPGDFIARADAALLANRRTRDAA